MTRYQRVSVIIPALLIHLLQLPRAEYGKKLSFSNSKNNRKWRVNPLKQNFLAKEENLVCARTRLSRISEGFTEI